MRPTKDDLAVDLDFVLSEAGDLRRLVGIGLAFGVGKGESYADDVYEFAKIALTALPAAIRRLKAAEAEIKLLKRDLAEIDEAVESVMPRCKTAEACHGCGCIMSPTPSRVADLAKAYAAVKDRSSLDKTLDAIRTKDMESLLRRLVAELNRHDRDVAMSTAVHEIAAEASELLTAK